MPGQLCGAGPPLCKGVTKDAERLLEGLGVQWSEAWTLQDTATAFAAWNAFVLRKRQKQAVGRPMADVLIGAFASRFDGLLTRNAADFRSLFPNLRLVEP